jgi:hypothetical protein
MSDSTHRTKLFIVFAGLAIISIACSLGGQASTPTAAPTSAPAATAPASQPTTVPPTTAPVPTATPNTSKSASFNQFSFNYDLSLATDVTSTVVPGFTDPSAPEFMIYPDTTEFNFVGYKSINTYHHPRIEIYAVADYEKISDYAKTTIAALKNLLASEPAAPDKEIPFLPVFNAAQIFHAQVQYLKFSGGQGVRFVTQFDQAYLPINNLEIIYTFQGLTDDGKYYISAILPVASNILPNTDQIPADQQQTFGDTFPQYLQDTVKKLDAQKSSDFSPDLSLLDAMMQSLQVK